MAKRIVVVGGGFGGLVAARRLGRAARSLGAEVILVDRSSCHTLKPKLPQAVGGRIRCAVHIPFESILHASEVHFMQADVTAIDPVARRVVFSDGEIGADILVLAVGGQSRVPGDLLACTSEPLPIWGFDQACNIRRRVQFIAEAVGRGKLMNPNVIVIGGGFVGTEIAAEIQHRLGRLLGGDASVTLIEAQARLLPRLHSWAGDRARRRLEELGAHVLLGTRAAEVTRQGVTLANGDQVVAGTVVWAGGVQTPGLLADAGLVDATGRVPVGRDLQSLRFPGVYAVGDCAYIAQPGSSPSEPSAHQAEREARAVARNIVRSLHGKSPVPYRPDREKYVIDLGPGCALLSAPPLPRLYGRVPELLKEVIMARHLWAVGGMGLLRQSGAAVLLDAARRRTWDTEPLTDGVAVPLSNHAQ